jgi:nitroreductase
MSQDLIQTIFARRSIRKYQEQAVSEKHIDTLLQAAMAAPSASNRKPWHFVVITERERLDGLADLLPYGKMLAEAPLAIAVCGEPAMSDYWVQDCSAATENLLLAATALGLGAVWLGVYPREERAGAVAQRLELPTGTLPLNVIAIGHPAEEKEARTQYDQARVHRERW